MVRKLSARCSICSHPEKARIELLKAAGASLDALAAKFSISRDSLHRHWKTHVPDSVKADYLCGQAQLADLAEVAAAEGTSVIEYLKVVRTHLMARLADCSEAGDARAVAMLANSLTGVLERIGRVTGEIATIAHGTINVTNNNVAVLAEHPAFARLQSTLLRALGPFPEARTAVVDALAAPRLRKAIHGHLCGSAGQGNRTCRSLVVSHPD